MRDMIEKFKVFESHNPDVVAIFFAVVCPIVALVIAWNVWGPQ